MKKIISAILVILFLVAVSHATDENAASYDFNFKNVPVSQILDIYKNLSKAELIVSSNLGFHNITLSTGKRLTKEEAEKFLENSLLKQARIVFTHLDGNRISVTYNDQLPLEK